MSALTLGDIHDVIETVKHHIAVVEDSGVFDNDFTAKISQLDLCPRYFFHLMHFLNAQQKASLIEDFIIRRDSGVRIPPSMDIGDYCKNDSVYVELKTSTSNKGMKLNIRQIRPWQKVNYYLCSFINELDVDKSKFYLLTKEDMDNEIALCGKPMHGTKTANKNNINVEYGISFPVYSSSNATTQR